MGRATVDYPIGEQVDGQRRTHVNGGSALRAATTVAKNGSNPKRGRAPHHDDKLRVSVVIAALNEADNLPHVLPRIPAWVHEVILVDGGSTDATIAVASELNPHIRVLEQKGRGKGNALREGFNATTGDLIVMLDADGSTDPCEIPFFVGALVAGADFAKGTRYAQGGGTVDISLFRSLGNRVFTLMFRMMFRNRCTDLCYGYNAFKAAILPILGMDADGFEVETLMSVRAFTAGLRVVEIPSFEARRIHGQTKLRAVPDGWRVLRTLIREWLRSGNPTDKEEPAFPGSGVMGYPAAAPRAADEG